LSNSETDSEISKTLAENNIKYISIRNNLQNEHSTDSIKEKTIYYRILSDFTRLQLLLFNKSNLKLNSPW